ncbi:MAG: kinase/pyrophosphorylase [Proteobacteria bacterium]|nr:pyruvate, water dikinase regulatory protein [Alphaproteobacteria bacterium]NCC03624.1 kinase/pyrophosphorylase [Pseudomonadota bacterium]
MNLSPEKIFHIHLVSDATGETISSVARAGLVQFGAIQKEEHHWTLIRTKRQLDLVFEGLRQWPGLVLYTFINDDMAKAMHDQCQRMGVPSLSVLAPVISVLSGFFGVPSAHDPGKQHELDKEYFKRIEAMDFAMSLDDGNKTDKLNEADVIILGVSRTSKTPTCIYLSHRGIKAANVPIIPGIPLDIDFARLTKPMIIGLTSRPDELVETRRSRLRFLNQGDTDYIDPEKVREEVLAARRLFAKLECPVIDVTRKSVEETAAEILLILKKRDMEQVIKDSSHE